eukprot:scaffold267185_cov24-Tisochrysis_lutea.AAC.1
MVENLYKMIDIENEIIRNCGESIKLCERVININLLRNTELSSDLLQSLNNFQMEVEVAPWEQRKVQCQEQIRRSNYDIQLLREEIKFLTPTPHTIRRIR